MRHGRNTVLAADLAATCPMRYAETVRRETGEDAIRFVKQSYNLENIRVLRYRRLKNMVALPLAVIYFN